MLSDETPLPDQHPLISAVFFPECGYKLSEFRTLYTQNVTYYFQIVTHQNVVIHGNSLPFLIGWKT